MNVKTKFNHKSLLTLFILFWISMFLLFSQKKSATFAQESTLTSTSSTPTTFATATLTPTIKKATPTETFILPTAANQSMLENITSTQQIPVSAWRAPIYPVPWGVNPHDHFLFERPISVEYVNWSSEYTYGVKLEEFTLTHTGIDIRAQENAPVLAAGDGVVQWSGFGLNVFGHEDDPYGYSVVIRHNFGYQGQALYTVYSHLSEVDVTSGDKVKVGEMIGKVGETGNATGPHLHFEVRLGENQLYSIQNPLLWISPPIGTGILVGDIRTSYNIHIPYPSTNEIYSQGNRIKLINLETKEEFTFTTYGSTTEVKSDPYYQENLVVPDLPAGQYEIQIKHYDEEFTQEIEIKSGEITYFKYILARGFIMHLPEPADVNQIPFPSATPTLTPTITPTPTATPIN
jgi:murein DD-endopeptidase MepM/ murein hydrolase activator NlpD